MCIKYHEEPIKRLSPWSVGQIATTIGSIIDTQFTEGIEPTRIFSLRKDTDTINRAHLKWRGPSPSINRKVQMFIDSRDPPLCRMEIFA